MDARLHDDAADFGPVAHWVYRRNPVLFTSELTALRASRRKPARLLLSVVDDDGGVGAALQMPGDSLLVSGLLPTMAKAAAVEVAAIGSAIPGISGLRSAATAFVAIWSDVAGVRPIGEIGRTLYRLGELVPPEGMQGSVRPSRAADAELLVDWLDAFFVDAHGAMPDVESSRRILGAIDDDGGDVVLWTVDGVPVSMARIHAPAAGMCRIGPVYTPPASRGHGFGAAVTAAAVRSARDVGARDVVLFADVSNPGANRIYQRLGFVAVADCVEYLYAV